MKHFIVRHTNVGVLSEKNKTFEDAMKSLLLQVMMNDHLLYGGSYWEIMLKDENREDKGQLTSFFKISSERIIRLQREGLFSTY